MKLCESVKMGHLRNLRDFIYVFFLRCSTSYIIRYRTINIYVVKIYVTGA